MYHVVGLAVSQCDTITAPDGLIAGSMNMDPKVLYLTGVARAPGRALYRHDDHNTHEKNLRKAAPLQRLCYESRSGNIVSSIVVPLRVIVPTLG